MGNEPLTFIIHSTHGDFHVNDIGLPLNFHELWEALSVQIIKFDFDEYKRTYEKLDSEFDILDLGYWYKASDGTLEYEAPEPDFRKRQGK